MGVPKKSGHNVSVLDIKKGIKVWDLGELRGGRTPGSIIKALQQLRAVHEEGGAAGAAEVLARSGHGKSEICGRPPSRSAKSCGTTRRKTSRHRVC